MNRKERILNIIHIIAMLIIACAAILPLLQIQWPPLRYVFAVGAIGTLVVRMMMRYKGDNIRLKRLNRMEMVSSLCYMLSAFFMFYPGSKLTDWLAFLTAGAVLQVYSSFMISRVESKERVDKKK
ncbi:MAG: hypothetical protein RSA66_02010 [Muribaculaceae bacterium]